MIYICGIVNLLKITEMTELRRLLKFFILVHSACWWNKCIWTNTHIVLSMVLEHSIGLKLLNNNLYHYMLGLSQEFYVYSFSHHSHPMKQILLLIPSYEEPEARRG